MNRSVGVIRAPVGLAGKKIFHPRSRKQPSEPRFEIMMEVLYTRNIYRPQAIGFAALPQRLLAWLTSRSFFVCAESNSRGIRIIRVISRVIGIEAEADWTCEKLAGYRVNSKVRRKGGGVLGNGLDNLRRGTAGSKNIPYASDVCFKSTARSKVDIFHH